MPGGDGIGELKDHCVKLGGGHGVDIVPGHHPVLGIGPDLANLRDEAGHQVSALEDEITGKLGVDVMVQGPEAAADPVHQVPLVLAGERHHGAVALEGSGQLGPGVGLVLDEVIDKDQAHILR